jgi:hypothetical protein
VLLVDDERPPIPLADDPEEAPPAPPVCDAPVPLVAEDVAPLPPQDAATAIAVTHATSPIIPV